MFSRQDRITIFMSRFHGRTDVFAQRWQKHDGTVSGYSPVYADWQKKTCLPFTADAAEKHLLGNAVFGVYPLLEDNTSHFIAADFDGADWKEAIKRFAGVCRKYHVAIAIERSRSGNGAHAWCFFETAYPAYKSRRIFFGLLREAGIIGDFDKDESFDRLFPNQDYHSGKGLGNLIAFPLQGSSRKQDNTVFVDPDDDFLAIPDQWGFLNDIELMTTSILDHLFSVFQSEKENILKYVEDDGLINSNAVPLVLAEYIIIPKRIIPKKLATFLREELNFFNAEYVVKQKLGVSAYNIERWFKTLKTDDAHVLIPRGFLENLTDFLNEQGIEYSLIDQRNVCNTIELKLMYELFEHQKKTVEAFTGHECGVLVAPPGSGKTIMGLELIARKQQPALILVHRKQIYDQWMESIEHFLGIPKKNIGQFASTKKFLAQPITVAMVQTLARMQDLEQLKSKFGLVLVDECHHMPARMFRDVVTKFNPRYLFGLTATPTRKYNDEKLIYAYLGNVIHEMEKDRGRRGSAQSNPNLRLLVRNTNTFLPFDVSARDFQALIKLIMFDSERNRQISADIAAEAREQKKCLVLTERKEHVEMLRFYLKREFEIIALTGDMTPGKRKRQMQRIKSGQFQIIIATGQLLGEGSDIQNLDCLFLVFPFSFSGKLIQYVGRLLRGNGSIKLVYDYRDEKIRPLERMFLKRMAGYKKYMPEVIV